MASVKFDYGPIIDEDTIRILHLQPSESFDAELRCELQTTPRSQAKPYEALSYWWGAEGQEQKTLVIVNADGEEIGEIQIGIGLATALQHLRLKHKPRRMWADAVCINQESAEEKKNQVLKMDVTYKRASIVIVWLGAPSEPQNSQLAMNAIRDIGSKYEGQDLNRIHRQQLVLPKVSGLGPYMYLPAIRHLIRRDWFQRLWVIQEVCLPPADSIQMHCGYQWMHFWQFANFQLALFPPGHLHLNEEEQKIIEEIKASSITNSDEAPLVLTRQFFAASQQDLDNAGYAGRRIDGTRNSNCTMLRYLWTFRHRECSNALDRVYALKSLAFDLGDDINPDYELDVQIVYRDICRKIIERHKKLDILGMCHTPEGSIPGSSDRPSWTPDFELIATQRNTWQPKSLTMYLPGHPLYYTATSDSPADPRSTDNPSELQVSGFAIDTVTALGAQDAQSPIEYLVQSKTLAEGVVRGSDPQMDRTEAFWRTLITNRTSTNFSHQSQV